MPFTDATLLYEVELVRFSESPLVDGYEELNSEERYQFSNVIKHAKAEYMLGLGYCKDNNPRAAATRCQH